MNDSKLFVNSASSTTSNWISVVGGTGVTSVAGSLLSISQTNPAISITNGGTSKANAFVSGLVYAYGSAATGYCQIQDATIRGSVVCNRFNANRVLNAGITYAPNYFPNVPPEGFEGYVMKKQNSWDGL